VYRGEKVGLHTRVFITSLGLPTYEAKEIGLSHIKNEKWPHDTSVVVTGNEVTEYFKVALSALSEVSPKLSEKIVHIPHGMLRLASGKMSSRTGQVISAEDLLDDIKKKLQEKFNEDKKEAATDSLLDIIAIGAIKYAVLRSDLNKDIIFDLEKALSFIGDSGPYLQYTHARCKSLLKKGKDRGIHPKAQDGVADRVIERKLQQFPEVVERARSEYAPHYVCTYMHELASAFNNFYGREKIIDGANSSGKLYITQAVAIVIANGLALLGIQAPDSM
jgi:arginyl-tRNA synthetase